MNIVSNPSDIWKHFFENSMTDIVVTNTNKEIDRVTHLYTRASFCRPTNENEINALIGILILSDVQKSSKLNASELFCKKGTSPEIFRLAMSEQRFRFLLRHIIFNNRSTRVDRRKNDELAPIRDLFDMFVDNCKNMSLFLNL